MKGPVRVGLAIGAGAAVWAVLWIGGTTGGQAALPELMTPGQRVTHVGVLLGLIGYSVPLSILAGFVTAAAAAEGARVAVWLLAALQLTLGVIAELSYWALLPVWYHLVFLSLVVPATLYGGVLRRRARPSSPARMAPATR